MATFFGVSTAVPVDNGSNATTTITLTPPASMLAGDLVVVYLLQRGTATFSVGVTGGQSWNIIGRQATLNIATETFWAKYNGTWGANPRFDFSAGLTTSAIMIVFRPDNAANNWLTEQVDTNTATVGATIITIPSVTPANGNNVTVASWMTADDNTWGTLTGTNWVETGLGAQYRNLAGTDQSMTFAYQLQVIPAATNDVSKTQLTLGADSTRWRRITFYEAAPVLSVFDPFGMMGFFGL